MAVGARGLGDRVGVLAGLGERQLAEVDAVGLAGLGDGGGRVGDRAVLVGHREGEVSRVGDVAGGGLRGEHAALGVVGVDLDRVGRVGVGERRRAGDCGLQFALVVGHFNGDGLLAGVVGPVAVAARGLGDLVLVGACLGELDGAEVDGLLALVARLGDGGGAGRGGRGRGAVEGLDCEGELGGVRDVAGGGLRGDGVAVGISVVDYNWLAPNRIQSNHAILLGG